MGNEAMCGYKYYPLYWILPRIATAVYLYMPDTLKIELLTKFSTCFNRYLILQI